jgi:hypothetical protein
VKHIVNILLAGLIFLSGVVLIPLVGLPSEGFRWQAYADAYQPLLVEINHETGMPGSFFTISGFNFPPSGEVAVLVNGTALGTVPTDSMGSFVFLIDTTGAEAGYYFVTTDEPDSPSVRFWLNVAEPLRPQEGEGTSSACRLTWQSCLRPCRS